MKEGNDRGEKGEKAKQRVGEEIKGDFGGI